MRFVGLLGLLCLSAVGFFGQQSGQSEVIGGVRLQADQIAKAADYTMTLKGNARVILKDVTIYADEVEFNPLTGDLTPTGHVKIQVQPGWNSKARPGEMMDPPMPSSSQGH
jgi:lipopolysaccharide assembly outer membrane protein LptD (OstA)